MGSKLFGAALFVAALAFAGYIGFNDQFEISDGKRQRSEGSQESESKNTLSRIVSSDLESAQKNRELPPAWNSIQSVSYNFNSNLQRQLIGQEKIRITDRPDGRYKLEIEFIDIPDENEPGIILQMSLFEISSNNKVWELGRTYGIKEFTQKNKAVGENVPAENKKPD